MKPKQVIMHLFENERQRRILVELYQGRASFSQLKKKAKVENNTTLSRDLTFLDGAGLIVNIFERTDERSYSHYELNEYGKRIAQIVIELEREVNKKAEEVVHA
jgi:DNA-binding HxlR family transcriptional regulator